MRELIRSRASVVKTAVLRRPRNTCCLSRLGSPDHPISGGERGRFPRRCITCSWRRSVRFSRTMSGSRDPRRQSRARSSAIVRAPQIVVRAAQEIQTPVRTDGTLANDSDVYGLALRMLWNRADAENATQEILVRAITRLVQLSEQAEDMDLRIAVNYVLDVKKSAVERMHLTFEQFADDLADGLSSDGPAHAERSLLVEEGRPDAPSACSSASTCGIGSRMCWVALIRIGGHLSYGGYDVQTDGQHTQATSASPVHG